MDWNKVLNKIKWFFYDPIISEEYWEETEMLRIEKESGEVEKFVGGSTVWFHYPSFKRCGSVTEARLCNIWTKLQYHK